MTLNKPFLTNTLVFTGLLFSAARMIRGTDNLYILAILSFVGIWIFNYKTFWDLKFKKTVIWFLPFGIWAVVSVFWSLEPFVSFSRGLFYIFISSTAVLIGFIYKRKLRELFAIFALLNAVFIFLSFISLVAGIPSDAWTANHGLGFTSIFLHQNTLAAVLMFTLIGPPYYLLVTLSFRYASEPESQKHSRHSDESQNLKEDADMDQHDNIKVCHIGLDPQSKLKNRHSEPTRPAGGFISESKDGKNMDSHFRENDNVKGTGIPNLPDRQAGLFLDLKKKMLKPVQHDKIKQKGRVIPACRQARPACLKPESIFSFILILSNLYFIYLSYSRAVMLALFIGGLAYIYLVGSFKFNLIFTIAVLLLGMSIFYLFHENITKYLKKSGPDYFTRRNILWEPSYQAALNGGIFGLGYGVTDPTIKSNYKKENKFGELKREKGNGILALIEEVGIVGLVLFLIPVIKIATDFVGSNSQKSEVRSQLARRGGNFEFNNQVLEKSASKRFNFSTSQLLNFSTSSPNLSLFTFSFLLSLIVHSQFEGWWTGVSSLYLLVFIIFLPMNFVDFQRTIYDESINN